MTHPIAIVGMACVFPDCRSPDELWENVLARRRAFRAMPPERLRPSDYVARDRGTADRTYSTQAAVIEGYEFDRLGFRVAGATFRATDLVHWLALDVSARALTDAGFPGGEGLPRAETGVLVGNSLTGEFSRANLMRLRWPYVRRVLESALCDEGWSAEHRRDFLTTLEARYKEPFPPVGEDSLAGGLSNTIAGRVCNHFHLQGGGYTVDGACASSLLAVANACSALDAGDLDAALAGGVDLSLDPFELVGFAKTGALAADAMWVYDTRANGFWPGEGCGMVVLMRLDDALARGCRVEAVIRGWGISSDGQGGITRPEADGQRLALRRAYRRAGFGIETVAYFEGHGTGTAVGDATELRALSSALEEAGAEHRRMPPAVGSIKANIGHTKAAAGVAGLIKAACAVQGQTIPPHVGWERPLPELDGDSARLRVLRDGECWPADLPLRAGVSAMGFGGINTHVVIEGTAERRRDRLDPEQLDLIGSDQDTELLLIASEDFDGLRQKVGQLLSFAGRLAWSQLADLAAVLSRGHARGAARAALVASRPEELAHRLETLRGWLDDRVTRRLDLHTGIFVGTDESEAGPRVGFLFPGQGTPASGDGGVLADRYGAVRALYLGSGLPVRGDASSTEFAQPAIVTASLSGLHALAQLGVEATVAVGHSLGELTALHWAGALSADALVRIAGARSRIMAVRRGAAGAMASLAAGTSVVNALLTGEPVVIAGYNALRQTVVSGPADAVERVATRARASGIAVTRLPVGHAFHSPLMRPAAGEMADLLAFEPFNPLVRQVASTIEGAILPARANLCALLCRQVTEPVRFTDALDAAGAVDLWIEVGPGCVLGRLASQINPNTPAASTDAGGPSWDGLLRAAGAAFALGAMAAPEALCDGRLVRPLDLDWSPRFFANPCELAPTNKDIDINIEYGESPAPAIAGERFSLKANPESSPGTLIRQLVAGRCELPFDSVVDEHRLLSDLHLNSITVSELVSEAAQQLGLAPLANLTDYADATIGEVALALEQLRETGGTGSPRDVERHPWGVDSWVRAFTLDWVERPLGAHRSLRNRGDSPCEVFDAGGHPGATRLRRAFEHSGAADVVVCLPPEPDERQIPTLLAAAKAVLQRPGPSRFVLVQHGGGAASWARTLHLEAPKNIVCVVDVPADHPSGADWALAEASVATGFVEARYDYEGRRFVPVLRHRPLDEAECAPVPTLGSGDVLLVSGGGKGIAAECALHLARRNGIKLALLGRSRSADDPELRGNLSRMAGTGVEAHYVAADVTDADAVRCAVREFEDRLGPVTAILHGAGANVPKLLSSLDEAACIRTLAPKVLGARHLIDAVDPHRLRLFVAFGSIIARTGLPGEADYALANEWLTRLVERLDRDRPACRCLVLEWSVWSGTGMGQRLGRVDALAREGVTPIPPDEGVALLSRLLEQHFPSPAVVVTGRFGTTPTLGVEQPELPLRRFLERPRVYYPGVELVVEADLSADADPYLADHVLGDAPILPAVMGLEAMSQVAMALGGSTRPPVFEDVAFSRPVRVPVGTQETVRIAALARGRDTVEVVLRTGSTKFSVDHFRGICRFGDGVAVEPEPTAEAVPGVLKSVPLDCGQDLYGGLLFQQGRFRRLRRYQSLSAWECLAEIEGDEEGEAVRWFGPYLPSGLMLGSPAARDAAIHAIQGCIPYATVIPIGVARWSIDAPGWTGRRLVRARQRSYDGATFLYDMEILSEDGRVLERCEGLKLRAVQGRRFRGPWTTVLLAPCIERRLRDLVPDPEVAVFVERDADGGRGCGHGYREGRRRAVAQLLGPKARLFKRPDGKPEVERGRDPKRSASLSYAGELMLFVTGLGPIGCDLEPVAARPISLWRDLIGTDLIELAPRITHDSGEDVDAVATRLWAAAEALKKAGSTARGPLVLAAVEPDGWVVLGAGSMTVATFVAEVSELKQRFAVAIAARGRVP